MGTKRGIKENFCYFLRVRTGDIFYAPLSIQPLKSYYQNQGFFVKVFFEELIALHRLMLPTAEKAATFAGVLHA
ncbi:MAG: hypothetical protein PHC68_02835 [Syntrophorhabdaceae bacterium]|nr:hypothetical protein [Syntrophorhabdaceae bacterium]